VVELVIEEVRRSILDGSLPPGAPVSIAELSARLKVSHIPVREALRRLEGEGLVDLRPSRSAVVTSMSADDLSSVFQLRSVVEGDVMARAAKLYKDADLKQIQEAFDALRIEPGDDAESVSERHVRFHRLLLAPAATDWDWRLFEILWQAGQRYLFLILGESAQRSLDDFQSEHKALLDAAKARSPQKARKATRDHLASGIELVGSAFEQHSR
jgi:DNA-binding GntR family transcriptional regulator